MKKTKLFTIPLFIIPFIVSCGGSKPNPVPTPKSFSTDSWDTVCYYANQGVESLKAAYKDDYEANGNTFTGLIRVIPVNHINHLVRVIGEEDDYIANSDGTKSDKTAALTFEFMNCISFGTGSRQILCTAWENRKTNINYWESSVQHSLNSTDNSVVWYDAKGNVSSITKSVYQMIADENDWASNIKNVSRSVITKKDNNWNLTANCSKIFLPSLCSYMPDNKVYDISPKNQGENHLYDFYSNIPISTGGAPNPVLVRYEASFVIGAKRWMCSPACGKDGIATIEAWYIGQFGEVQSESSSDHDLGIAPLFAI